MPAPLVGPLAFTNDKLSTVSVLTSGQVLNVAGQEIVANAGDLLLNDQENLLVPIYVSQPSITSMVRISTGTLQFASGAATGSTITVTDQFVRTGSIVMLSLASLPANMTSFDVTSVANGSFVVTMQSSANLSANVNINYLNMS